MHIKKLLVAAVLGYFLLTACKETKKPSGEKSKDDYRKETPENKPGQEKTTEGEYYISAPHGWTKTDTIMMGQRIVFVRSPRESAADDFVENVNVVTEKVGNIQMGEYLEKSLTNIKNGLTNVEQMETSDRSINGLEFKCVKYSHVYNGLPVDVNSYFTLHSGTAYIITCSAKGGTISKWQPEFEEVVRSFKLN